MQAMEVVTVIASVFVESTVQDSEGLLSSSPESVPPSQPTEMVVQSIQESAGTSPSMATVSRPNFYRDTEYLRCCYIPSCRIGQQAFNVVACPQTLLYHLLEKGGILPLYVGVHAELGRLERSCCVL